MTSTCGSCGAGAEPASSLHPSVPASVSPISRPPESIVPLRVVIGDLPGGNRRVFWTLRIIITPFGILVVVGAACKSNSHRHVRVAGSSALFFCILDNGFHTTSGGQEFCPSLAHTTQERFAFLLHKCDSSRIDNDRATGCGAF